MYKQPIPIKMFRSGDLVDQQSILGQYHNMFPYNGFYNDGSKTQQCYRLIKIKFLLDLKHGGNIVIRVVTWSPLISSLFAK
jgi:hypothetical protein